MGCTRSHCYRTSVAPSAGVDQGTRGVVWGGSGVPRTTARRASCRLGGVPVPSAGAGVASVALATSPCRARSAGRGTGEPDARLDRGPPGPAALASTLSHEGDRPRPDSSGTPHTRATTLSQQRNIHLRGASAILAPVLHTPLHSESLPHVRYLNAMERQHTRTMNVSATQLGDAARGQRHGQPSHGGRVSPGDSGAGRGFAIHRCGASSRGPGRRE
jgi:hypothetical protein